MFTLIYGSAGGAKVRPPPAARAPTRAQQGADELRRLLLTYICGPSVLTRRHARVVAGRTNDMELLPMLGLPRAGPALAWSKRGRTNDMDFLPELETLEGAWVT